MALPNPTTKGGAVENLIQMLIDENEVEGHHNFYVCTIWEENAAKIANRYKSCEYIFLKYNKMIRCADKLISSLLGMIGKRNPAGWKLLWKIISYYYIERILKKNMFDRVIVENSPFFLSIFKNDSLCKKYDGKLFFHVHNDYRNLYGTGTVIEKCKAVITISNYIKRSLERQSGITLHNVVNLYNCAKHEMFCKEKYDKYKIRKLIGLSNDDIVVMFSGRLTEEKGFLEALKAVYKISNNKIKLMLIGGYFYKEKVLNPLQEKIDFYKNALGDRLVITGYIDYSDIPKYYRAADIALIPSLWNEPACMSLIESMNMGLPFITTNVGGIPEYADEQGGFILDRDKDLVERIKDCILKLSNNSNLRTSMGKYNERKYINCDEKNYYKCFCDIIS